jgi:ABC-type bacteriocin/lantibiotic exporter with double-glycine peptidase domain
VAIARALLKNSAIMCFDEATSALDSETENKIIYNLFSQKFLNQTVIFITHKNDIPINFNRILRVENLKVNVKGKPFGLNDLSIFTIIINGLDP